ncbi:response regulator transcription factor [Halanaerobium congolense]|uniref:Stage 0 sporulation protein A homolog n=1 Tax=Halanaerobium congolense TaxID=54121 RepID=A0A1G6LVD6_9FIRM|nr:response regulator [Halanaerobium congolense]PUU91855.1 MAG: two-component system, response regulator YesN [Halanaerobium sp.]PXV67318.1 two-component system response regulator YesN [Halanaerobium congolense]TDS34578.1 two-component system response regulator YesN [Halanaerobium congolense]TDX47913.1 two-component system response regulator YesN [Halanaerobium congolense]SDC47232.1 two-component system, response regulator YesN [Halanaerobium congolense]
MVYNLLLVDDEKPIREKLINNTDWKGNNYQVFAAADGAEALEIIKNRGIDILVTDIQMPKLSGMNLIEKARENSSLLKVIVISGFAEFEYAQKSIRYGVNDYLLKPFRSEKLLEVVNKARDELIKEKNNEQRLALLRAEMSSYINENKLNSSYNWLIDDQFFQHQSLIMDRIDLNAVLKRGSRDDILKTVNKIIDELESVDLNREKLYVVLNNLILESFKIIKDLDYRVEDLLEIINKEKIEKINSENLKEIEIILKEFLLRLHDLISFNPDDKNQQIINEMKEYIAANYQDGITLSEMARKFNLSSGHLSNLFHEETGESFSDYLNMIRLNKAKELLKTTDDKIYQIADQLGFNDAYYFSSWFKKLVGASPTTYRDNINLL